MAYPASLDTFTPTVNNGDTIAASHMTNVRTAIVAIETELGTDPAGTVQPTVRARFEVNEAVSGVQVPNYTNGTGTTAAVAAGLNAALSAGRAQALPVVFDGSKTYDVSAAIVATGDGLRVVGNGATIRQNTANTAVLQAGGENQSIQDLGLTYGADPTSANTASVGFELVSPTFMSNYEKLRISRTAVGMGITQTGTNTCFSTSFRDIRVNGFAIAAMKMNTFPYGSASSTGCVFDNLYLHNNYPGTPQPCTESPVQFKGWDEVKMGQINIEWCIVPDDVFFMQGVAAMNIRALHFEGLTLNGTQMGLLRNYETGRLQIASMMLQNITLSNTAGSQRSLVRVFNQSGAPASSVLIDSVRITNITNAGARNFAAAVVEASSANAAVYLPRVDEGSFVGGLFQDATSVSPPQVRQINDRIYKATSTTAPAAGGAGALPATPAGYVTVNISGTDRKIPYY